MIPTPGRCLAMMVSAIALAGALLMAGVPGAVLLALTPGLLCLSMAFTMGHAEPSGKGIAARRDDHSVPSTGRRSPPRMTR